MGIEPRVRPLVRLVIDEFALSSKPFSLGLQQRIEIDWTKMVDEPQQES